MSAESYTHIYLIEDVAISSRKGTAMAEWQRLLAQVTVPLGQLAFGASATVIRVCEFPLFFPLSLSCRVEAVWKMGQSWLARLFGVVVVPDGDSNQSSRQHTQTCG